MMKNNFRKLAAVIASGIMAACCLPLGAAADNLPGVSDDPLYDGSFYYALNADDTYTITQCSATIVTTVPSIRNGKAVTAIGDEAFANCTGITELSIPDSIKTIGSHAFYGCTGLQQVTLPNKLEYLGDNAFFSCSSLTEISLPDTLTKIEPLTFALCDNLAAVDLPDSITEFGEYAFYQCSLLNNFRLPASLTKIGENAMGSWFSVTDIDASACSAFVYEDDMLMSADKKDIYRVSVEKSGEINIPDGVSIIRGGAFSTC